MSIARRAVAWSVVALLWIALTAGLTLSVSRLVAQRIGLASEPLSVIGGLAPPHAGASADRGTTSASGDDRHAAGSRPGRATAPAGAGTPPADDGPDGQSDGGDD